MSVSTLSAYGGLPPIERHSFFYLAPQHEIKPPFLAMLNAAQKSIDIEIYGFADPDITNALLAAHARGVTVRILFDHTQSCGPSEKKLVKEIAAAGIEHWVGTSPKRQIRHTKFTVVDGKWIEIGSLNYSETAFMQNNSVDIQLDVEKAAFLLADWEANKAWLLANEAVYNQVPPDLPVPDVAAAVTAAIK